MRVTFASESVTEGHPDKVCDKISDSVLDAALALDPKARVACETMVSENLTVITGEVSDVVLEKLDIAAIARQAIREIGYTMDSIGFCADTCKVDVYLKPQSPDISQGVSAGEGLFKEQGAGDQGMMFGYATKEARLNAVDTELMPAARRSTEAGDHTGLVSRRQSPGGGRVRKQYASRHRQSGDLDASCAEFVTAGPAVPVDRARHETRDS
jgi:S-adenosylmethionine synthetase